MKTESCVYAIGDENLQFHNENVAYEHNIVHNTLMIFCAKGLLIKYYFVDLKYI